MVQRWFFTSFDGFSPLNHGGGWFQIIFRSFLNGWFVGSMLILRAGCIFCGIWWLYNWNNMVILLGKTSLKNVTSTCQKSEPQAELVSLINAQFALIGVPVPQKHVPLILPLWNSGFYLYTYYVFSSPVSLHNVWRWRLEYLLFSVCLLCEGLLLAADEGVCVLSHLESGVRSQVNIYEHIWLSIWWNPKKCHLDTSSFT